MLTKLRFLYCIKVYLRNVWSDNRTETNGSSGLPSYHSSSVRTASARAVYQRVKKVLWLQWRSITIVFFLLIDIIFFAIVWVQMDNALETAKNGNLTNFMPYLTCLLENGSDREKCFASGQKALINESTAVAILMLLSVSSHSYLSYRRLSNVILVDRCPDRTHDGSPDNVLGLVGPLQGQIRD